MSEAPPILPRLMLVTQRQRMQPSFEGALEGALRAGARLAHLREKDLPPVALLDLARRAARLCEDYGARLVINGAADVAQQCGVGAHFPENATPQTGDFFGVSVHSLAAARRAAEQGASYLVFGSVFETLSHPGEAPAGLAALREVCAAVRLPVFAIGGTTARNAASCLAAGAHGVAAIGAAWNSAQLSALLAELNHG